MKHLFAFLAIALICLNAWAASVESPGTVYLYGEAKDVSIRIVNEEDISQDFSVEFSSPTQFELSQYTGTISANRSKTVTLTLYPGSDLLGQTYKSKLEVTLGSERYVKQLHLVFRGEQEEQEENGEGQNGEDSAEAGALTGFFTLFAMPEGSTELALNILLVVIAAILLIAFIARFIKRMEGR